MNDGLKGLNAGSREIAIGHFLRACASRDWAIAMAEGRPFQTSEELIEKSELAFATLRPDDWLEAFRGHPKIGDREVVRARFQPAPTDAVNEQSGAFAAADTLLDALANANVAYEVHFGHIFITCATGKDAGTMLDELRRRLGNDRETELRVAGEEQKKITRLRLGKILDELAAQGGDA